MAIYQVHIVAGAIDETVTTSADSAEQARERAVGSALQRVMADAVVTVEEVTETLEEEKF